MSPRRFTVDIFACDWQVQLINRTATGFAPKSAVRIALRRSNMKNKITSASVSIAIVIVTVTTIYLSAVDAQSGSRVSARRGVDNTERFDPATSYRLTTEWQGKVKSLDVRNDNYQLVLVDVGNYSGQLWKISLVGNGYYRLTNQWRGNQSLDIDND